MNTFFLNYLSNKIQLFFSCTQRIPLSYLYNDVIPSDVSRSIVSILIQMYVEQYGDRIKCNLVYMEQKLYSCIGAGVWEFGEKYNDGILTEIPNFIKFEIGKSHSMVLTQEGLFCCGLNSSGELGLGDNKDRLVLTKMNISDVISFECKPSRLNPDTPKFIFDGPHRSIILTEEGLFHTGAYYYDIKHKLIPQTNILTKINI